MPCKKTTFTAANDIPPLTDKVILVTGGNVGLGKQSILEYARHCPAQIWLTCRSIEKGQAAADEIQGQLPFPVDIRLLAMDLSSLDSVAKAASVVLAQAGRLDILLLNAGIMAVPPALTVDGYEVQFGTNYMGHVLLARLLLPLLDRTASLPGADVRIVMVASDLFAAAPEPEGIRFKTLRTEAEELPPNTRYGQSKLASILWVQTMAMLYPQFTCTAVHPGIVRTNLLSHATDLPRPLQVVAKIARPALASVEDGVKNQLWASVAKQGIQSGTYYTPVAVPGTLTEPAKNETLAGQLWEWTEAELSRYTSD
jgi:NAD(P)-dependent dehydrogenase (short-subunit alcohol dehydrogenase family)